MRKSPFSTQRGNGKNSPGFGWKSGGSPGRGRGYGRPTNYEFSSPNHSQNSNQSFGDDFIPFNTQTPSPNNRKTSGNWSSPSRGKWQSPGHGNYRQSSSPAFNNYGSNNSPRDNFRHTPYFKNSGNSFRGQRKSFHRGNTKRNIDISSYVNLKSFLEDPWADLLKKATRGDDLSSSRGDDVSPSSFNSSQQEILFMNDSVGESTLGSSQEFNDSLPTSQESIDASLENSLDLKMS